MDSFVDIGSRYAFREQSRGMPEALTIRERLERIFKRPCQKTMRR
jgi:hypothetical protein